MKKNIKLFIGLFLIANSFFCFSQTDKMYNHELLPYKQIDRFVFEAPREADNYDNETYAQQRRNSVGFTDKKLFDKDFVITGIFKAATGNVEGITIGSDWIGPQFFAHSVGFKIKTGETVQVQAQTYKNAAGANRSEGFTVYIIGYYAEPVYRVEEIEALRLELLRKIEIVAADAIKEFEKEEIINSISGKIEGKLELLTKEINDLKMIIDSNK